MTGVAPALHAQPGRTHRRAALRIALVSDWFLPRRGGIELQLEALAAHLTAAGHHVDVLTSSPGEAGAGVVRLAVPRLPGIGVGYTPALARTMEQAIDRGRYDVVHAHASILSPAAFTAVRAARRRDLPCVLTFHSVLRTAAALLGLSDAVSHWARDPGLVLSGVSTLVAGQLRRGVPAAHVRVLPNGADLAWWRALPPASAAAAPSDPAPEVRFVTAMRLTRKKRPLALLPVAAALCAAAGRGQQVRLLVAGEGPERTRLERAARRAGLGDVVTVLGWQSRAGLRALYRTADAFVLPTVRESFGVAALEARAAGLPVLARAGSGVADFVTPGVHGTLASSDAALAACAAGWVRDPAALAALRRASAADVPLAFGWEAVIDAHLASYAAAYR